MYRLNVQVTTYGRQSVPHRDVVMTCDPLKIFGATIISLQRLNLKSSNCHPVAGTDIVYLCTKVKDYSFSCSRDMVGAHRNLNGSRGLTTPL